jgi:hypothetical protein
MNTVLPIAIETKDLVGLLLLFAGVTATTLLMLFRPEFRSLGLFLIVAGLPASGLVDLDIYSAYWYRGTTRGFEVTAFDVLALGLLLSSLLAPRRDQPRWHWPASLTLMLLYLFYCTSVTVVATPAIFGLFELSKLVRGLIFFLAAAFHIRRERDLGIIVLGLATAVFAEAALAIRERLLLSVYRPTGTLDHPNSLSMYFCLTTPVLVAAGCSTLHPWIRRACWVAATAAAWSMVLTLSRAGLPVFLLVSGGTLAWCGSWRPTPARFAIGLVASVLLACVVVKSWPLIVERYGQATLQEEYFDAPGESRGYYIRQAAVILDEKPFGVGLNNWSYWVSRRFGKPLGMHYENYDDIVYAPPTDLVPTYRFAAPAHSLAVLTAGEVGWVGLGFMLLLWLRWLGMGASFLFTRRPEALHRLGVGCFFGIVGIFLTSLTEWTFRQTQLFLTFNILIGVLAALIALRREEAATVVASVEEPEEDWDALPEPVGAASTNN